MNKQLLLFVGEYPYQTRKSRVIALTCLLVSVITLVIPQSYQLSQWVETAELDNIFLSLPALLTNGVCVMKMVNLEINKKMVTELFDRIKADWETIKENELHVLKKFTENGNKMCRLYKNTILGVWIFYMLLPLVPIGLDVILPLNETRRRNQVFEVDYGVDPNKFFFPIYIHSAWSSFYTVIMIITVDTMYMMIAYHACSLFALCGYRIKSITEERRIEDDPYRVMKEKIAYTKLRECVLSHKNALQFASLMERSTRTSYLLQVGINMMIISITAVQTVIKLHETEQTIRLVAYTLAQMFHLFFISTPGQKLMDYSEELTDTIYTSDWYTVSIRMQKLLAIMQIRCRIPCKMTAGSLYDMSIENFGKVVKASMSYFTMFSSLREG